MGTTDLLDILLDRKLKRPLAEAFLREARKAGVSLADMELMSYDVGTVNAFLTATRENRANAFLATLDRERLERRSQLAAQEQDIARRIRIT